MNLSNNLKICYIQIIFRWLMSLGRLLADEKRNNRINATNLGNPHGDLKVLGQMQTGAYQQCLLEIT